MTCIITGAVAFNGHAWVGGDLHQIGDCYIFNCCMHPQNGEAMWAERESWPRAFAKVVDFSESRDRFERRGMIAASVEGTRLNQAAEEYIRG